MKKTYLCFSILMIFLQIVNGSNKFQNSFLFCLKPEFQPLQISLNRSKISVGMEELDDFFTDYQIIKIEPWIKSSTIKDRKGDIFLNRIYRVYLSNETRTDVDLMISLIQDFPFILYAEYDYKHTSFYEPNDPGYNNQCSLEAVNANLAWDNWNIANGELPGNEKILLASIDTGVDYSHIDLIDNIWINQEEIPIWLFEIPELNIDGDDYISAIEISNFMSTQIDLNGDGISNFRDAFVSGSPFVDGEDDDGNGHVDDLLGWDMSNNDNDPFPKTGVGVLNTGGWAHGTHVAGVLGATTDNGIGMASTAFNVKIMSVKCSREDGEDINDPMIDNGYEGIYYAAKTGFLHGYNTIINASWGGSGIGSSAEAILDISHEDYGAIIIAAAGNGIDNEEAYALHYPASHDNVISVCALACNGNWGNWATYHETVDLAAPGDNIYSTIIGGGYQTWDGSSMASPNAASVMGLVWSYHNTMTNDEIISMVQVTADSTIYDLNPDYIDCNGNEGSYCLGAGMVDAHKAIAQGFSPNIQLSEYTFTEINGDGDGRLNPGEIGILAIYLKNEEGWADAENVMGRLSSIDSEILVLDDEGFYGDIIEGDSVLNVINTYKIAISSEIELGNVEFELQITGNSENFNYEKKYSYENIFITLNQKGFPINTFELRSSPLVIDYDGDGDNEIILGDNVGVVHIYDHEGNEIISDPFPFSSGSQIWGTAAAADMDRDGLIDFVITSKSKHLYIFDKTGLKVDYDAGKYLMGTPSIGNLDDDDDLEVVIGGYSSPSSDNKIFVINPDGTDMEGFPLILGEKVKAGIALADFNGNGKDDMVIGTDDDNLHLIYDDGEIASGFPYSVNDAIQASPSIVEVNGEKIILIGSNDDVFYAINANDGTLRFSIMTGDKVQSSPSILEYGGTSYVFFGSNDGMIYAVDLYGNPLANWPISISGSIAGSIIFSDIDGDGEPEIVSASNVGDMLAFHLDGSFVNNFPIQNDSPFSGSPLIIDLDGDGDLELFAGSGNNLFVVDMKEKGSSDGYWSEFRGGYERRGSKSMGGCTDSTYCNYDSLSLWNDGSCSNKVFICANGSAGCDCNGICNGMSIEDCSGTCNGQTIIDECGLCGGNGPTEGMDCDGNPLSIEDLLRPNDLLISKIYPNPFNSSTKIHYFLSENVKVQMDVYNMLGQRMENIVNDFQIAGEHQLNLDAINFPSGIYFITMRAGSFQETCKVLIIK